ncbi:ParA family protein [Halobium palmae]|uniref:ParA family protein n=1 Tax=Halobium palmae TaxID=1776492 RepID=A0ABD5RWS6_9EURY
MSSERSEPYPIVVSNQKGGVGKTTVAINVAGALSDAGARVLVVDLDPQGYLTTGVGLDEEYMRDPPSLYDALTDPQAHSVADLVCEHQEFDVLPANIDMFNLEQELVSAMRGRERLSMLLESVDAYDFVVVDCPPSLGILTDNALLACRNLLIPAEAEDTSIRALDLLFKQIDTLEDNYGASITERALVVSNVDYPLDGEQKGMLEWFDDTFADRIPVFELRSRAAIKRAFNDGVSVFAHDEECDQREELERVAAHFVDLAGTQEVAQR